MERALARLAEIRDAEERTASQNEEIRAFLQNTDAMVFAAAARLVPESDATYAEALCDGFRYFEQDGADRDPGCKAKFQCVEALRRIQHVGTDVFRQGSKLVQKEAAWGPPIDTAAPLRALCGRALVEVNALDALDVLADQLADPEWPVREAAAGSIADLGRPGGAQLLRFKLRIGDEAGDVISACMLGLLHFDSKGGLELSHELLSAHPARALHDDGAADAIAVALGESRAKGSELVLLQWFERVRATSSRELALTCIAMQRTPESKAVLLELIRHEPGPTAKQATNSLVPYLLTESSRDELLEAAAANESGAVLAHAKTALAE